MDPATAAALMGGAQSALGALGANAASKRQAEIAWQQLRQANKNKKMGRDLARTHWRGAREEIRNANSENRDLIKYEKNALAGLLTDNRGDNRRIVNGVDSANMGRLGADRRATLDGIQSDRYANVRGFQDARDKSLGYFAPAQKAGDNALAAYAYNLGVGEAPAGYDGLTMTPGAQFRLQEGMGSLQGSAAARGGLNSGATLAALERFRQGVAGQDRDAQMAQLMSLVGVGQGAAGQMAGIQSNAAGAIANQRNFSTGQTNNALASYGQAMNAQRTATGNARMGINDAYTRGMAGVRGGYTDRMLNNNQTYVGNMRDARAQQQGAVQAAMSQSLPYAANALANAGNAAAGGALGVTNAIAGGVNTGFQTYGYLGGTFGQGQTQPAVQQYGYGATMPGGAVSPPMPRPR